MPSLNAIPLRSLRAVEATARLGSLAAAAAELAVSTGAVSQQIAVAERTLGVSLFERHTKGMRVLPRAEAICAKLTTGFLSLSQALALADERLEHLLTVSVAPTFAARWLIWRLPLFQAAHPDIRVRLDANVALIRPGQDDVDLCLRVGQGRWSGVKVEKLFHQIIFPVCSPALASMLSSPLDLVKVPIIQEPSPNFGWSDWLAPGDPAATDLPDGPVFSDASLCLDAAISGSGVFLSYETLSADALANGQLVEPFGRKRATANAYWLVSPEDCRMSRPARTFRSWLIGMIELAGFGKLQTVDRSGISDARGSREFTA